MKTTIRNICYCLLFITTLALSQSNYWERTDGPYSTYGNSIITNTNGDIYLGAKNGLYISTDKGNNWTLIQNTPFIEASYVLISRDSLIYVVSNSENSTEVFLSIDSHYEWSSLGLNSDYAHCSILTDSGTLLVGTQSVYKPGGIFRLSKGNIKWSLVLQSGIVYCFGVKENIVIAGTSEGFFRSFDDGIHWSEIQDSTFYIVSAIGKNRLGDFLASNWMGTFLSKDNGDNWEKVTDFAGSTFSLDSLGNIYLGAAYHLYISQDDGKTWTTFNNDLPNIEIKGITCDNENNIYALCYKEGLFHSADQGMTWHRINRGLNDISINSILIVSEDSIFVGTSAGVFCSPDQGNHWNQIVPANYYSSFSLLARNSNGYIFTGGYDIGIYSSADQGLNWEECRSCYYDASAIITDQNNAVYIGSCRHGIIVTPDNGKTWRNLGLNSIWIESATIAPNGTIFWGTNSDGVYAQYKNGVIQQVCNSIKQVINLTCNSEGVLYAGTYGSGIYKSVDIGKTWDNIDNNSPARYIFSLFVDKADNIYASTFNYGVIYLNNSREDWEQLISGLTAAECYSFAISPEGRLYVGTNNGLFRSVKKIKFLPTYSTPVLTQNYPNPFNSMSNIYFFLPKQSKVKITVYDLLGREIKVLINTFLLSGWHNIECLPEGLHSGIYIYTMQTDNYSCSRKFVLLK